MDWTLVLVFVAGLSIGTIFGVILSGFARAAKSDDEARSRALQESGAAQGNESE